MVTEYGYRYDIQGGSVMIQSCSSHLFLNNELIKIYKIIKYVLLSHIIIILNT